MQSIESHSKCRGLMSCTYKTFFSTSQQEQQLFKKWSDQTAVIICESPNGTTVVMGRQDENNMSPQEGWRHNINILCTTVYNFCVNKTSLYFSIYCPSNANIF